MITLLLTILGITDGADPVILINDEPDPFG